MIKPNSLMMIIPDHLTTGSHTWSLMNRFQTGQGPCRANLHKWGLTQPPSCDCGQRQTMNHIVDTCPLTKSEGGLNLLHKVDVVTYDFWIHINSYEFTHRKSYGWNLLRLQPEKNNQKSTAADWRMPSLEHRRTEGLQREDIMPLVPPIGWAQA